MVIDLGCGKISAGSGMDKDSAKLLPGEPVTLAVRSENIRLHDRDTEGLPALFWKKTLPAAAQGYLTAAGPYGTHCQPIWY